MKLSVLLVATLFAFCAGQEGETSSSKMSDSKKKYKEGWKKVYGPNGSARKDPRVRKVLDTMSDARKATMAGIDAAISAFKNAQSAPEASAAAPAAPAVPATPATPATPVTPPAPAEPVEAPAQRRLLQRREFRK